MMNLFLLAGKVSVPAMPEEIDFGMLVLRMLLFLGLVLVLIYLVLRKVLPVFFQIPAFRNRTIKILERTPIDQKKSLIVVEVQDKVYLLGSAEGQINVLMELDREKMNLQPAAVDQKPGKFEEILKKVGAGFRPASTNPDKS